MENILISGGSGLVGRYLANRLFNEGYKISILTRGSERSGKAYTYYHWDPIKNGQLDQKTIEEADHVINLAGANLAAKRWTKAFKRTIYESRVDSTSVLASAIQKAQNPPKSFISASAVNYYGIQRKGIIPESSAAGSHFLSKVCADWEQEAHNVNNNYTRVAIPRLGTVLAPDDSAFTKMKAPVALGLGAPLGSGKQCTPWIHIDDLVSMISFLIAQNGMEGAYNAAAPEHTTNAALMKTIAKELHKPFFLPNVPSLALKVMLGPFADVLMTHLKLDVSRIQKAGFEFKYPGIQEAVDDLINR